MGGASLLLIALSIVLFVQSTQKPAPLRFSTDEATESAVLGATVTVDVEGAVLHPGVYTLPHTSRIDDAIAAAGGLSPDADGEVIAQTINRAAKLVDGAKIYIPVLGQESSGASERSDLSTLVNINTSSQSQLEELPGVGPVTAGKIINNRPYQTVEELLLKKAVGQALFDKIKDKLTI